MDVVVVISLSARFVAFSENSCLLVLTLSWYKKIYSLLRTFKNIFAF